MFKKPRPGTIIPAGSEFIYVPPYWREYKTRVEADGGAIVSELDISAAHVHAADNKYWDNVLGWYSSQFGYKDAGSGKVSKWYDLTVHNFDFEQASDGSRPVWTANQQNGKAGLIFDGSDDTMVKTVTNIKSVVIAYKATTTSGDYKHLFGNNGGDTTFHGGPGAAHWISQGIGPYSATNYINGIGVPGSTLQRFTDFKIMAFSTPATMPVGQICWGQNNYGGRAFPGNILELLLIDIQLSDELRRIIETGINERWQMLTLNERECTISQDDPALVTCDAHGASDGDRIFFKTGGTLNAPLVSGGWFSGTKYYVRNKTDDDFNLSSTVDGTLIETTSAGSGIHRVSGPTIAVEGAKDAWKPYCVSLLHFDGIDESTDIVDESGKSWTAHNHAQIDTAQSVFGGSSLSLDGVDDYVSTPAHTDLDMGSGDFTLDLRTRPVVNGNNYPSLVTCITGWTTGSWGLRWHNSGQDNKFGLFWNPNDPLFGSTHTFIELEQHHVGLLRRGTVVELYVDEVLEATAPIDVNRTMNLAFGGLCVGGGNWDGGHSYFTGHIDELRILKGFADTYNLTHSPGEAYSL
jgi:hypothetical protein